MNVQASFAATLVDEWARAGVREVVVSPGSRSSPLTLAILDDERLTVHLRLDERSAGFFAIGCSRGSGRPVVVVTTSGTAAAEVHAAVIEADLAGVPLIICTADRPPELHAVGAPQAVDQNQLFGSAVRFFLDPGVPDEAARPHWRSIASRLVAEATAGPRGPGPVHANLRFREPFGGAPDDLPPGREAGAPWHEIDRPLGVALGTVERLAGAIAAAERGLIIAGAGAGSPQPIFDLARALAWPVLAEPRAWPRRPRPGLVAASDAVLRSPAAAAYLRPDVVVHLGAPHLSRVLNEWIATSAAAGTRHILIDPYGAFRDPQRVAATIFTGDPGLLLSGVLADLAAHKVRPRSTSSFLQHWLSADAAALEAIAAVLEKQEHLSEPEVARLVVETLPPAAALVVAASMPMRDLEWFVPPREEAPTVFANRGANGIDGTASTILGVAATFSGPVVGLLGDLAFLHDLSGLVFGTAERVPDATLVVIDNGGGGIFSLLPYTAAIERSRFERAFGTPQAPEVARVASALGATVHEPKDAAALRDFLQRAVQSPGIDVIVIRTDRADNAALHGALGTAAAEAVDHELGLGTSARPGA